MQICWWFVSLCVHVIQWKSFLAIVYFVNIMLLWLLWRYNDIKLRDTSWCLSHNQNQTPSRYYFVFLLEVTLPYHNKSHLTVPHVLKSSSRQLGCINRSMCWDCQLPVCMHPSLKDITLFATSLSLMCTVNVCVCVRDPTQGSLMFHPIWSNPCCQPALPAARRQQWRVGGGKQDDTPPKKSCRLIGREDGNLFTQGH